MIKISSGFLLVKTITIKKKSYIVNINSLNYGT
jgi:hypothetical protein